MAKLTAVVLFVLCWSIGSLAQAPISKILPIVSSRSDVVKEYGLGKKVGSNQTEHLTRQFKIAITYLKSECLPNSNSANIEPYSKVLEVKMIPTREVSFDENMYKAYRFVKTTTSQGESLYFAKEHGVLIGSPKRNGGRENISFISLVPKYLSLSTCASQSLPPDSAVHKLKENFSDVGSNSSEERHEILGSFFVEDLKASKETLLSDFTRKLKPAGNLFGYIAVIKGRLESSREFLKRKREITNYLNSRGIDCQQYLVIEGGTAELGSTYLAISPRSEVPDGFEGSLCKEYR